MERPTQNRITLSSFIMSIFGKCGRLICGVLGVAIIIFEVLYGNSSSWISIVLGIGIGVSLIEEPKVGAFLLFASIVAAAWWIGVVILSGFISDMIGIKNSFVLFVIIVALMIGSFMLLDLVHGITSHKKHRSLD